MSSAVIGYTVRCNNDGWLSFVNNNRCISAGCIIVCIAVECPVYQSARYIGKVCSSYVEQCAKVCGGHTCGRAADNTMRIAIIGTAEARNCDSCVDLTDHISYRIGCIAVVTRYICKYPGIRIAVCNSMRCCAEVKACEDLIIYPCSCAGCCMSSAVIGYTIRSNNDGWLSF